MINFPLLLGGVSIHLKPYLALFLCLFFFTDAYGWRHNNHHGAKQVIDTIIVDQYGHGNFTSIQAAINSIPPDHPRWTCIRIRPGIYREPVRVDKPYIMLKGFGRTRTKVVYNDQPNMLLSATLAVVADNVVAKGISFINSRNLPQYGGDRNHRSPAAAGYIMGDKISFHRCGFYGVQDTLWDVQGRHFYYRTTIVGSVDFICGNGQSIFEKSVIYVLGGVLPDGLAGFITAHARGSPAEKSAFIFKKCSIIGQAKTYLGRPWGKYARVIYYKTTMSDIVMPQGWDVWYAAGNEDRITFAQDECMGAGAVTKERVSWEKKLSKEEIEELTSLNFINSDKWINSQPINFI